MSSDGYIQVTKMKASLNYILDLVLQQFFQNSLIVEVFCLNATCY